MKEGIPPNAGDTLRNRHARQTTAICEGSPPNAGDGVGDGHTCQVGAPLERRTPNAGYAIGYRVVAAFPARKLNQCGFVFVKKNSSEEIFRYKKRITYDFFFSYFNLLV